MVVLYDDDDDDDDEEIMPATGQDLPGGQKHKQHSSPNVVRQAAHMVTRKKAWWRTWEVRSVRK